MTDDLKVIGLRSWHDADLQPGAQVREVTKVRFWLGTHGPFQYTFDRDVSLDTIETAVRDKRAELERLGRL